MAKILKTTGLIICILLLSFCTVFSADGVKYSSMLGDIKSPAVKISMQDGETFPWTGIKQDRKKVNKDVLDNKEIKYSLYDRFGPNLYFVPYFGEVGLDLSLVDKVYSTTVQGEEITIGGLIDSGEVYLSTLAYDTRPVVLSKTAVDEGAVDPRVTQYYTGGLETARDAVIGNMALTVATFITTLTAFLIDGSIFTAVFNTIQNLMASSLWDNVVRPILLMILPVFIVLFLISLIKYALRFGIGTGSSKEFFKRAWAGFVCIAILFTIIFSPLAFNKVCKKSMTLVDDVFQQVLNIDFKYDDVISSDKKDNIIEAALWKTAIFNNWSMGMFGRDYDHAYTQYAEVDDKLKLPQSFDKNTDEGSTTRPKYNSAELTGDIGVPLGNNVFIKNWAAFAWSTQSIYHIDSLEEERVPEFPVSEVSYGNREVYTDVFRWVDAMLNISPQYIDGEEVSNYLGARAYDEHFIKYGFLALFDALLLLFFYPAMYKKLKSTVILAGLSLYFISQSFIGLAKDTQLFHWQVVRNTFWLYIEASVQLFLLVYFYTHLVGKGPIHVAVYIILALCVSEWRSAISDIKNVKRYVKYNYEDLKGKFNGR